MLMKLLKHDLKYVYKTLILLYGLILFCAIGSKLFSFDTNVLMINILHMSFIYLTFILIAITIMYNITKLWSRFKTNVYGDEAYLTHTLPITKKDIYLSKILTVIITITFTLLISFLSFVIVYDVPQTYSYTVYTVDINDPNMSKEEALLAVQNNIEKNIEENRVLAINGYKESIFNYILSFFSCSVFMIWVTLTGYCSIIVGNDSNKNKTTEALILGVALFFLFVCVNFLLLLAYNIFVNDVVSYIGLNITIIIYYSIISLIYYLIGIKKLKNRFNVT